MKKVLLGLSAVAAAALMIVGCGILNPTTNDSVTITIPGTVLDSVINVGSGDQNRTVTFKVVGQNTLPTIDSVRVKTSAGAAVTAITSAQSPTTNGDKEIDDAVTVTIPASSCSGNYDLIIYATSGSSSSSKSLAFRVTGGTGTCGTVVTTDTALTAGTASLGAESAADGSFLDADAMVAYHASTATANQAVIDVHFGTYGGASTFMSPAFAAANYSPTLETTAPAWTTLNATMFFKAPAGTDINTLDSLSKVRALYDANAAVDHITVALNDVVIVMTNMNYPVAIGITGFSGSGQTADITLKGYHR